MVPKQDEDNSKFYYIKDCCYLKKNLLYARKFWHKKNLMNSHLCRFDELKVDKMLRLAKCLQNVFW